MKNWTDSLSGLLFPKHPARHAFEPFTRLFNHYMIRTRQTKVKKRIKGNTLVLMVTKAYNNHLPCIFTLHRFFFFFKNSFLSFMCTLKQYNNRIRAVLNLIPIEVKSSSLLLWLIFIFFIFSVFLKTSIVIIIISFARIKVKKNIIIIS